MYKEHKFKILCILGTAIAALFFVPTMATNNQVLAASIPFALQDTKISETDPTPGHQMHQVVIILPPRNDSKIYSGTLTFTASTPVELIVTHPFNLTRTPANNATFIPEPLTIPGGGLAIRNQTTAFAILHEIGRGVQFDTIPFVGSGLSLHNRVGQNFTVSYSVAGNLIDATGIPN